MTIATQKSEFVSFTVKHSDLIPLSMAFSKICYQAAELRHVVQGASSTVNYLKKTSADHEGSDLVTIELHMKDDVFHILRSIKAKRFFLGHTANEIRCLELWKLQALIESLPEMYKTQ